MQHAKFSEENGIPELHHVLYPRFPSFVQAAGLLSSMGFSNIYNITILYYKVSQETGKKDFQGCPTPRILDLFAGKYAKNPWHVAIHVEKISLLSLGMSRRNLEKWLEKTWYLKDGIIAQYMSQEEIEVKETTKEERSFFHRRRQRRNALKDTNH